MAYDADTKFDRRTVARYINKGTVSERDYEKHLKALPDLSAKAVKIEIEQPSALNNPTR